MIHEEWVCDSLRCEARTLSFPQSLIFINPNLHFASCVVSQIQASSSPAINQNLHNTRFVNSISHYLREKCSFTCHHTDSTVRENIQDSIFSNAAVNVLVSCQSSTCHIKLAFFVCLSPDTFFHSAWGDLPSLFFPLPLDSTTLKSVFWWNKFPKA